MILENINFLCKKNNISIAALEQKLGIGNGAISRWGVCSPRVKTLKLVADYFSVTVDDLLRDDEQTTA